MGAPTSAAASSSQCGPLGPALRPLNAVGARASGECRRRAPSPTVLEECCLHPRPGVSFPPRPGPEALSTSRSSNSQTLCCLRHLEPESWPLSPWVPWDLADPSLVRPSGPRSPGCPVPCGRYHVSRRPPRFRSGIPVQREPPLLVHRGLAVSFGTPSEQQKGQCERRRRREAQAGSGRLRTVALESSGAPATSSKADRTPVSAETLETRDAPVIQGARDHACPVHAQWPRAQGAVGGKTLCWVSLAP